MQPARTAGLARRAGSPAGRCRYGRVLPTLPLPAGKRRGPLRSLRSRLRRILRRAGSHSPAAGEPARGVAAQGVRTAVEPRGESVAQIPRRTRQAAGDPQPAVKRTERAPRRWQQVGGNRWQQPVWPRRFSPRGRPHGGRGAARQGDQGVGGQTLSQLQRRLAARPARHSARAAQAQTLGAQRQSRRAGSRRHHKKSLPARAGSM